MKSRHLSWPCQLKPVFEETWLVLLSTVGPRTVQLCHLRRRSMVWSCTCKQLPLEPYCPRDLTGQFSSGQNCGFIVIIKNHHCSTLSPIVTFNRKVVIRLKVFSDVLSVSYNQKQLHISLSRKLYFTSLHTIYIHWSLPYVWHKVK